MSKVSVDAWVWPWFWKTGTLFCTHCNKESQIIVCRCRCLIFIVKAATSCASFYSWAVKTPVYESAISKPRLDEAKMKFSHSMIIFRRQLRADFQIIHPLCISTSPMQRSRGCKRETPSPSGRKKKTLSSLVWRMDLGLSKMQQDSIKSPRLRKIYSVTLWKQQLQLLPCLNIRGRDRKRRGVGIIYTKQYWVKFALTMSTSSNKEQWAAAVRHAGAWAGSSLAHSGPGRGVFDNCNIPRCILSDENVSTAPAGRQQLPGQHGSLLDQWEQLVMPLPMYSCKGLSSF